jgi:phosphoglucomutase
MLDEQQAEELEKCFGKRIAFGTAGLRAAMKPGLAYMNDLIILQTSQGLAQYVLAQGGPDVQKRGIVIGYDGRHNSELWARLTAATFLSKGFRVYLFSQLAATPVCISSFPSRS